MPRDRYLETHWVEIDGGVNKDTGFYETSVHTTYKTGKSDFDVEYHDEKYFLIRPSPEGHLVLMVFDRSAHSTHVPQLQPKIIRTYHSSYQAKRRLEKESSKYAMKLMKDFGLLLKTARFGFRKLEDLEPL
jgi:hypothetical protein